jgi:hypothetical protein
MISFIIKFLSYLCLFTKTLSRFFLIFVTYINNIVQGGSNMTGTICV